MKLIDPFGRTISYLRFSVTDHCNYRCHYCRDEDHFNKTVRTEVLSYEEIERIMQIFADLGISKVRLTGGEPLLRTGISKIIKLIGAIDGITDIPLSTNAHLLEKFAGKIHKNGVNRVNISIDSLIAERFAEITRGGELDKVINGIDAAIKVGMRPIKINMVVMRGVNDDEIEAMIDFAIGRKIDIRFIETMPIGSAGINALSQHYSETDILKRIDAHLVNNLIAIKPEQTAGPAKSYLIKNTHSSVGIISAVSNNFCSACNRIRLTAKGQLILCLGQKNSVSLRDALRSGVTDDEVKNLIIDAISHKPKQHDFNTNADNINTAQMVEIGG
ncbi:MAG: GTP 3',8-cyclase MoaA [Gammaproteobacteria bacterium]|uniref:GTP 3',8-cyclase n=1 Tax=endosymbiont of Bathymodiolus septemdierum str. Myojin knoll TaxID=1303921 RepID=A0A0P0US22_9GAMM|nr:GTP 3',8-cyclase MoaA [Bathymodiolus septemdierum thioautotrophic gill symbiont]RUA06238.1 MAG: GTP 3',8-cyclase MoaA [Gammaproteobacteria bacterium]BAS68042.1 molybdenum cofactor biosynthesis protein [endosymbiont of Bathymodiolus septemdierum str. Myojin knoll]